VVNPNTVQRAYEQLEREGLIQSRKGTGMFVAPDSKEAALNGVEGSVRAAITQAISAARAAGWSRAVIDRIYRQVWNDVEKEGQAS
jgi:GntR family transcriptional regulator